MSEERKTHDGFCFPSFWDFNYWAPPSTFRLLLKTSAATAAIADGWEHFIFPQSPGRVGEKSSLKPPVVSHAAQRCLSPRLGSRRCERVLMKAAPAAIPPPRGSLEVSLLGSSKGRKEPRSQRHSRPISHLWLSSFLTPLMKTKYNKQAQKYKSAWGLFNYSCWF